MFLLRHNSLRLVATYRPITTTTKLLTSSALHSSLLPSSFRYTTCSTTQYRTMSGLTSVFSPDAAPPAGPYSQAIKAAGLVFVSGQIPADSNGNVLDAEIEECTELCLKNLTAVLKAAGTDITKVVKTTVFLADMSDFSRVNSVYERHFTGESKPARSCVAVKTLPKNVRVEVECIALQ